MKPAVVGLLGMGLIWVPRASAWPAPSRVERRLDEALASFGTALGFSRGINPTPSSLRGEKRRFLAAMAEGRSCEPRFEYEPLGEGVGRLGSRLMELPAGRGPYGPLLGAARGELLSKLALLEARGTPAFQALAAGLHPMPDRALVDAARVLLDAARAPLDAERAPLDAARAPLDAARVLPAEPAAPEDGRGVSDQAMAEHLRGALAAYGLEGWRVVVTSRIGARASVLPRSRVVKVRRGGSFTAADRVRLAHHEVGVHAVRAESGARAPLRIFTVGLAGYLATEEGLAAVNEVRHGIRSGLRLFALRVLAVHWAGRMSFSRVFRLLLACGVDEESAWELTVRAKRGLVDTGEPGAWPKDAVYLRGYLAVSRHLARGGSWDELMESGKVGLADLPFLRLLERRASPQSPGRP